MTKLPKAISRYFEASNAHDVPQMVACFAENAVVYDTGEDLEMKGAKSIQKWAEKIVIEYKLKTKPLEVSIAAEKTEVIAEVSGTFDGSPLQFQYEFKLENDKITFLSTRLK